MKLFSSLFFFFFSTSHFLLAQPTDIQILEKEITYIRNKIDSLPFFISSGLAKPYNNTCRLPDHKEYIFEKGKASFSKSALSLDIEKKEAYIRMYALAALAIISYNNKDYAKSTQYFQQALAIASDNGFTFEEVHNYRPSLNNNFFLAGDYTNAMKISSDGLTKSEKIKDTNRICHFSNVIGYIHMKQKNFIQAAQYFSLQLELSRAIKDTLAEAHALYNLADLAVAQKQYDKAIYFLQQSIDVYRSSAKNKLFVLEEREAYIFNKMAEVFKLKGDFHGALPLALRAVNFATNIYISLNAYDKANYFINAGDIYNRLHQPDSAVLFLRTGMNIAKQIIHREYIRDASEQLAIAFAQKKMFDSAYAYHSLFSQLKDSISNKTNQQEILQREASLKIEQQKQLQRIALEKQKLWRNIIIGIALFSLITLGFLYNRYRLRQKNRYQEQINRQQNELFNAIAVTQDQERKRIAEDIHDSLGSILSAAKLKLSALKESQTLLSARQAENWQVTLQLLDEASSELRSISHNIMPATLSKLGLVAALRNLITNISSQPQAIGSGMQISFSSHDFESRIAEQIEMSIYRIVLELINNIVKHAQATKVTVQLIKYPDYINLSVEDNGRGFNYEGALQEKKGIGLGNILSRVDYLKGKMDVDTTEGKGTTVIIDIPYATG